MYNSHYVYDYETLSNSTILCIEDFKTEETKTFVVHELRDDKNELIQFLLDSSKNKCFHIGFNNVTFDAQISQYIIKNAETLTFATAEEFAKEIYIKAQDIINKQNRREFQEFPEWKITIPQIDLFKLNNFGNPNKMTSLKWCQYSMDWHNLQDMPIHHTTEITTIEEINIIVGYCQNDVKSTKALMNYCKGEINLRKTLSKEYSLNLMSSSEPGLAKELFLKFLSEETGIEKRDLKAQSTKRYKMIIKDILLPYISFKTKAFQDLHNAFKNLVVDAQNMKGGFKYTIKENGIVSEFGLGGCHGACKAGIYESSETTTIMSSDVVSYYPNLAIKNKWAPAHLSQEIFCRLYEGFFEDRKKIPKKDPKNYVYKILLNATYGLSNDKYSFLYDPLFTLKIVCNGQLSLMMLYEMLTEAIPEAIPLLQNTDGIEMIIPKDKKDLYLSICKDWENITQLSLEHDEYKKMIIADVNSYLAVNNDDKYKCKGRFEFENIALHKNKSHLIVPKAIYAYFVNNILPEQYLQDNRNIFDYCGAAKAKGDWEFQMKYVKENTFYNVPLQKTSRYYISNSGCKIIKKNKTDGREIQVQAGEFMQTVFNLYEDKPWEEYDINEKFYLDCIYKEIATISPKKQQLQLNFE
jgi:hypothetical protein